MSARFKIEKDFSSQRIKLYGMIHASGKDMALGPVPLTLNDIGAVGEPFIDLTNREGEDFLQGLVNELYNAGYYPQQDSQKGELAQTKKHLDDIKQAYQDVLSITNKLIDAKS